MNNVKKHRNWNSRVHFMADGYTHKVHVPWAGQASYWWKEACADIMEVFGLPGDRYTSHPTADYIDFYFKSEKDKWLCEILLSDKLSKSVLSVLHS